MSETKEKAGKLKVKIKPKKLVKRDETIKVDYVETKRAFDNGIFYSDQESKNFTFPAVTYGCLSPGFLLGSAAAKPSAAISNTVASPFLLVSLAGASG